MPVPRWWPLPVALALVLGWLYATRPCQDLLVTYTTSLTARTEAQRQNILTAARHLDGATVAPGSRFSFNAQVGPRTVDRGFGPASAFLEGAVTRPIGGGICQVSSTLYAALQETSLPIAERVAHGAVVDSVPPGRDASVWYGKADLAFENRFDAPVRVRAFVDDLALKVEIWGTAGRDQRASLRFAYRFGADRRSRVVRVYRRVDGRNALLSEDLYRL